MDARDEVHAGDLPGVRAEIEALDEALLALIAERCRLACRAGAWKRDRGWPITDPAQEARVVRRAAERARALALDEEGVRLLFWGVIGLSRRVQEIGPPRGDT
jgi:chorismate mutase